MRSAVTRFFWLSFSVAWLAAGVGGVAQERPRPAARVATDPRVGLKAGIRDAGQAARNMELIASMPKPEGFFDPKAPAGEPTPAEREFLPGPEGAPPTRDDTPRPIVNLNFGNSDLAFQESRVVVGNFHGFNTYNIENPRRPRQIASVVCPGGQGDVSVHGNLLFMSVEQTRGRIDCGTGGVETAVSAERFRGVRIFDITDPARPRQVAAVQTCRGSHTHTLVPDPGRCGSCVRVRVRHRWSAPTRGARRLFGARCQGRCQHRAVQH